MLVAMLDGFDTQAVAFVGPSLLGHWKLSMATLGSLFSATLLGTALGAILFGRLSDRFGRRLLMAAGLALFGAMTLGSAMSGGPESLLILRVLAGLGLGGAIPSLLAFVAEYSPSRSRSTLIVVCMWGYPAGGALGGLLSIHLIQAYGWQSVFWVGGLMPTILAPLILAFMPESVRYLASRKRLDEVRRIIKQINPAYVASGNIERPVDPAETSHAPLRAVLFGNFASSTYLLGGSLFLSLLLSYFLVNWAPTLLHEIGLPLAAAISATVTLNLAGILGSFVLCRAIDHQRRDPRIMGGGFLVAAIASASIGRFGTSPYEALLTIAVVGFFLVGSQMALTAYTATHYPLPVRATAIGVTQAMGRTGSVVGPLLAGLLLRTRLSPQQVLHLGAIPATLAAFLLIAMRPQRATANPA